MRYYEAIFIVHPNLEEAALTKVIEQAKAAVKKRGGEFLYEEVMGKKRLAYPVEKQRFGTYVLVQYSGDGAGNDRLNQDFELNDDVLAHMVVNIDQEDIREAKKEVAPELKAAKTADKTESAADADAKDEPADAVTADTEEDAPEAATETPAGETTTDATEAPAEVPAEEAAPEVTEEAGEPEATEAPAADATETPAEAEAETSTEEAADEPKTVEENNSEE